MLRFSSRTTGSLPSVVTWCNTHRAVLRSAGVQNAGTSTAAFNTHSETLEREHQNDIYDDGINLHASKHTVGSAMEGETRQGGRDRSENSIDTAGIVLSSQRREDHGYSSLAQSFTSEYIDVSMLFFLNKFTSAIF